MLPETLSPQAEYVLASETANAGRVLVSRTPVSYTHLDVYKRQTSFTSAMPATTWATA